MHGRGSLYNKREDFLIKGIFLSGVISKTLCIKILHNGTYYIGSLNSDFIPEGSGELVYKDGTSKYTG